ncbi:serine/threonine phosphatase [Phormidium tenue FACHB-886]|nr:serine/threonine phosphatase [Phormidium tenue FACHB-886]
MLVCPHCQFENPDTHKFCQKCGDSLTEMNCSVCGTTVPFEAEFCSHCGAATGIIWRAILSPAAASTALNQSTAASPTASSSLESASLESIAQNSKYLDAQQRYQLLDSVDLASIVSQASSAEVEVRVLDRHPLQASLLEALHNHVDPKSLPYSGQVLIPLIAQLYLELQERYPSLPLPQIHEAWEQDGIEVVLLEDRTHLPSLLDFWQDEQVLPLQILHWLHEMVELWQALEPSYCCQSLLVLENLRVDEDYLLCLQRLYSDDPHHPPQLGDLGRFWQTLFQQSQRTQWGDLARLCSDLERGAVASLPELRSRIEEIATGLQPAPAAAPPAAPAAPELLNPFKMDDADERAFFDETAVPAVVAPVPTAQPSVGLTAQAERTDTAMATDLEELENILLEQTEQVEVEPSEEASPDGDDSPTVVLPMRLVSLEDAGATDIGRQRDHNEDNFSIQTSIQKLEGMKGRSLQAKGLYILCDGMGGHAGGEVASALAVETLQRYFAEHWHDKLPSQDSIREAIRQTNQAIYNCNQENARSGSGRMGTTLVLVLVQDTEAAIAHVGDSRLYSLSRRRGLERLTVDHEVGQREIQRGVEPTIAYARPDAYQLTQALGPRDENFVNPDVRFVELNEDMLLLLCSDGLTDNDLLEAYWQTHLEPLLSAQANLTQGVEQLIELANQQNGHDNITAIAIRAKVRPDLGQLKQK